jgi:hypothetical protein
LLVEQVEMLVLPEMRERVEVVVHLVVEELMCVLVSTVQILDHLV